MTEKELCELKEDMRQEMKEDSRHEQLMYSNKEYAIKYYGDEISDLVEKLRKISNKLYEYGHIISTEELVDLY
jgi:hypothetical protein